ncbi:20382_t:CDS:2, partial [Rhizophagus irregularis]
KLPKQWNSKQVFCDIEEYEEEFYWSSIQYSLSGQEHKHLIKFYEGSNSNINNYGMKYGRLRTSDGHYISSHWIKRKNKIARNNYCVQIRRTIDKVSHRPNALPQLMIVDIYGI